MFIELKLYEKFKVELSDLKSYYLNSRENCWIRNFTNTQSL